MTIDHLDAAREISQRVADALSVWSLSVHVGIVAVILIVNLALWLTSRREVVLTWMVAWIADTVALGSVILFAFVMPTAKWHAVYGAAKLLFALLLVRGFLMFNRDRLAKIHLSRIWALVAAGAFGVALIALDPIPAQGIVYLSVGGTLGLGGLVAAARSPRFNAWFLTGAAGCAGILFVHHGIVLLSSGGADGVPQYLSYTSFFDLFGEYLLGVACLLALGQRALTEMRQTNRELEAAQGTLRALVDADPLTGLFNRRRLRNFLIESATEGGSLIYLDINDFKDVNDRWGHMTGDRVLRYVADQLREVFRSEDGLFRLGGDEFLVVARGLKPSGAEARVSELRRRLGPQSAAEVPIAIASGIVEISPNAPLEEALALADAAMYRDKRRHTGKL